MTALRSTLAISNHLHPAMRVFLHRLQNEETAAKVAKLGTG